MTIPPRLTIIQVKQELSFVFVRTIDEAIELALLPAQVLLPLPLGASAPPFRCSCDLRLLPAAAQAAAPPVADDVGSDAAAPHTTTATTGRTHVPPAEPQQQPGVLARPASRL